MTAKEGLALLEDNIPGLVDALASFRLEKSNMS